MKLFPKYFQNPKSPVSPTNTTQLDSDFQSICPSRDPNSCTADLKNFDDKRTLYVGQLHQKINDDELKDVFSIFGNIVSCKVHKEHNHKSYCFIEYELNECAQAARIAMNYRKLHDIRVQVDWATTNSKDYKEKKLPRDKFTSSSLPVWDNRKRFFWL